MPDGEGEQAISLMMACDIARVHVRPQILAFSIAIIAVAWREIWNDDGKR